MCGCLKLRRSHFSGHKCYFAIVSPSWPLAKVFSRFRSLIVSSLKALRTLVTHGRALAHPVVVTFGVKAVLPDKNKKR